MRHATSVIYNTKKQMNQSVESINIALNELVPNDPLMASTGNGKENPEMQLVKVNAIKKSILFSFL